jgi:trehalose-6-phosphate synthase
MYRRYYDEAGARMLWFALHGLDDDLAPFQAPPPDPASFSGAYQRVNDLVARRIVRRSTPASPVLLHDYQLAMVPALVRQRRPQ